MAELPVGDDWKEGNEEDLSVIKDCFCPACRGGNATTTMVSFEFHAHVVDQSGHIFHFLF